MSAIKTLTRENQKLWRVVEAVQLLLEKEEDNIEDQELLHNLILALEELE